MISIDVTELDLIMLCDRLASSSDQNERRTWADEARWAFAAFEWRIRDQAEYWHGWNRR